MGGPWGLMRSLPPLGNLGPCRTALRRHAGRSLRAPAAIRPLVYPSCCHRGHIAALEKAYAGE